MTSKKFVQFQLFLIMLFMLAGFSGAGYLGYQNLEKMKKNLDVIYFGSYVKVMKLKDITLLYTSDLIQSILKVKTDLMSKDNALSEITRIENEIKKNWEYYKNSYLNETEIEYVLRCDRVINDSLKTLEAIRKIIASKNSARIASISYQKLFESIDIVNIQLTKLIEKKTNEAYTVKTQMNDEYESTLRQTIFGLAAMFLSGALLSYLVARNIKKAYHLLHDQQEELKDANKALKDLAIKDTLTGVYNRRYFDFIYEKELKKAAREGIYFTFLMIDIDHFKQYNDTYGHGEGDNVLKAVAHTLNENLKRSSDYFFRLGGEEFAAFFYGLDEEKSLILSRKLLKSVESLKIPHAKNSASKFVTISMGAVCFKPNKNTNQKKLIEVADSALYKAKESGRNQAAYITYG